MKAALKHLFAVVRIGIGVGLLWYLGASGAIEWRALLGLLHSWPVMLLALALLFVDLVVTAARLCVLMAARGMELSLPSSTRLALIGVFFNSCLPGSTSGDLMKIYYATEGNRGRRTEVTTIILLDRASGMFALMIWPLLVAPFFPELLERVPALKSLLAGAAIVAAVLLVAFLLAWSRMLRQSALLEWLFRRLPLGGYARRVYETVYAYRHHPGPVLASVGISLVAHTMSVAVTMLAITAVSPAGAAWPMAVLIPLGHLANTVPLTPGGLGVGEAAFNKLFSMAGLSGGAEGLLGWRLLTLLIGLLGLWFYLQGRSKFVHLASEAAGDAAPQAGPAGS